MSENNLLLQFLATEKTIFCKKVARGGSNVAKLDQEQLDRLYADIGSSWHNENDELIMFEYYEDGNFNIERRKTVFDYRTRTETKKYYPFIEVSQEDVISTYNFFLGEFEKVRLEELQKAKEAVKQQLYEARTVFKQNIYTMRQTFLVKSDWTQLPDVTFKRPGEKELWTKYRQYMRDMSDHPDWMYNIMKVEFPITPTEYYMIDPKEEVEYLTDPSHFENQPLIQAKLKLLRFMENLGLPSLITMDVENDTIDYDTAKENLLKALKKIDESFEIPQLEVINFSQNDPTLDDMINNVAQSQKINE